jgi:hypothetical protein
MHGVQRLQHSIALMILHLVHMGTTFGPSKSRMLAPVSGGVGGNLPNFPSWLDRLSQSWRYRVPCWLRRLCKIIQEKVVFLAQGGVAFWECNRIQNWFFSLPKACSTTIRVDDCMWLNHLFSEFWTNGYSSSMLTLAG